MTTFTSDEQSTLPTWSRSWLGLCAACFFLAEIDGVTLPFVSTYLRHVGWRYDAIGYLNASVGMASMLISFPAGVVIDRWQDRRVPLAFISVVVGIAIGLLPLVPPTPFWMVGLLVLAALGQPFLRRLPNALTLDLCGHERMDRAMGANQAWNHAGNIAAAVSAIVLVQWFRTSSVFFATTVASLLAAVVVLLIRARDLRPPTTTVARTGDRTRRHWWAEPSIRILILATALFHLANAPIMPMIAQKIQAVGGSEVQVASIVLTAQLVMVPTAILAGLLGSKVGHRRLLAVAFAVLPLRIISYTLTDDPQWLVVLQSLDGLGVGIFDVAVIAVCADLSRRSGGFNTIAGAIATAGGLGAVVGPALGGMLIQHGGFSLAFLVFAAIAGLALAVFLQWMPPTRTMGTSPTSDGAAPLGVAATASISS